MTLIESIIARAKSNRQRIVLPESLEERTLTAADKALADEIADIILIGNPDEIFALAEKLGLKNIDKATIIDPATSEKTAGYAELLYELRKNKGMTPEKAAQLVHLAPSAGKPFAVLFTYATQPDLTKENALLAAGASPVNVTLSRLLQLQNAKVSMVLTELPIVTRDKLFKP